MSPLVSGLVILATAGFVAFLSLGVMEVFAKAKHRSLELSAKSSGGLTEMLLLIEPSQRRGLGLASMLVLGVLCYGVGNALVGGLGMVLGYVSPGLLIHHLRTKRMRMFHSQLVVALQTISNALRAGLSLSQALEYVARESPPPLGPEFGWLVKELKLGVSMDAAWDHLSRRVVSAELQLVVVATNIARALGGNLSEMFETISGTIQERFRLEGRMDAITAQGKLQGWFVAAMPLVLGMVFNGLRPDLVGPMMQHAFGWALVASVVVMELLGFWLIRRIVRIDV